jgi:hypothetical protein
MSEERPLIKHTPFLWQRGPNYLHWCPGCKCGHVYPTKRINGPNWEFNNNVESPSFNPSMLIFMPEHTRSDGTKSPQKSICHYYLTNGVINYQGDCEHELAGRQKVALEPIPEDYGF